MFEVGFSELVMVGLVTLIFIGPSKLPTAARVAGLWIGKTKRTLDQLKGEISHQLHIEELRQYEQQGFIPKPIQNSILDAEAAVLEINSALEAIATPAPNEPEPIQSELNHKIQDEEAT